MPLPSNREAPLSTDNAPNKVLHSVYVNGTGSKTLQETKINRSSPIMVLNIAVVRLTKSN